MALTPIRSTKVVQKAKKGKKGGFGGLLAAAGAVAGGVAGTLAAPGVGTAAGAKTGALIAGGLAGASAGQSLGGLAGETIDPSKQGQQQITQQGGMPMPAHQEALRGEQILAGIQSVQNMPGLAEYSAPLTKAYMQSKINLKRMG